ncbi:MAG: Bax inhibitor-1/YccA family protein [Fusobacterium sp.]|uniref:Bax inhibitor-1/YccA family protein n=1 Tax=Fusobacterium sp. TaxID=68766 RepID=UPI0026DBC040|nr:Bax inhibitor-1/YccA family protein [Fusobacterium sp.]MDO4690197.1 Bax inhibitor-1/YccA family protein [Fusobacterium sp.]
MYNKVDIDLKSTNSFLRKVFLYMALGILISFVTAFYTYSSNSMIMFVYKYFTFLVIAEIAMVLSLSFAINKISSSFARILFFAYSALTGLTLSGVGLLYDPLSILYAFTIAFVIFVVMAIFGYTTQEDLSSYRRFFTIGLISLIIIGFINIFASRYFNTGPLYWIGTILGVVIFTGLIAYDVNRIKYIAYEMAEGNDEVLDKLSIIGALNLYLDFVNLFLYILRFFGRKK